MEQTITADRKGHIDSIMVKILKQNTVMPETQLLAEVAQQLLFPAPEAVVAERMNVLVQRLYF